MALSNDERITNTVKTLRKNVPDPGDDYYNMEKLPHNYQLSELLAAMGRVNLTRLDAQIERRRRNARHLGARLREADLPIRLPVERPWASHCFLHFVIRTPRRAELHRFLADHGVETRIHYEVPVYLVGPIRKKYEYRRGDFPLADKICDEILSLPVGPWFTDDQIDYVADQVQAFFRS
jgi:dTDP-4-amino-4,6-dideoxygalactose transaminase